MHRKNTKIAKVRQVDINRRNRYQLREAKQAKSATDFIVGIAKDPSVLASYNLLRFCTTKQQMLAVMLVLMGASSVLADRESQTCDAASACSPAIDLTISPGLSPGKCDFLHASLDSMQSKLPDSSAIIQRVLSQKDVKFVCVNSATLGTARATYNSMENSINYQGRSHKNQLWSRELHHELRHADDSRRHRTHVCNSTLFANYYLNEINDEIAWLMNPKYEHFFSTTPVWPPTTKRMLALHDAFFQDLGLGKIAGLTKLHKAFFENKKMTPAERQQYFEYRDLLSDTLLFDTDVVLVAWQEGQSVSQLPKVFMTDEGVIYHDLKIESRGASKFLSGMIKDPVSTFLHSVTRSLHEFNRYHQQDGVYFRAIAELATNARTGLSSAAIKTFYPAMAKMLAEDVACCDNADMQACENILRNT